MEILLSAMGAILFILLCGWIYETLSERWDRQRVPPPGELILVGSRKLHLVCMGERHPHQPTIVLEAGLGNCSFDWRLIQPVVAQWARVCSYDRAGYGWSDPGPAGRSFREMAVELHTLLTHAGESAPYILVGHSLGGILVREFAREFPHEVTGMVLVDSAHEEQISRLPTTEIQQLKTAFIFYKAVALLGRVGLQRLLARPLLLSRFPSVRTPEEQSIFLTLISRPAYFETTGTEFRALLRSRFQTTGLPGLEHMPLLVLQATASPSPYPRGYNEGKWQANRKIFDAIQHDLAGLTSHSRLIKAEKSLHAIQLEQPEVVLEAVHQLLEENKVKV